MNDAIIWDVTDPDHPAQIATVEPRRGSALRMALFGPDLTVHAVDFSPDGRLLAVAKGVRWSSEFGSGSEGTIAMWDLANPAHPALTGTLSRAGSGETYAVAFSPDQRLLASGHEDATVTLWDVSDPAQPAVTATLTSHLYRGHVRAVAFSPDGLVLASGSTDKTVKLWDAG